MADLAFVIRKEIGYRVLTGAPFDMSDALRAMLDLADEFEAAGSLTKARKIRFRIAQALGVDV